MDATTSFSPETVKDTVRHPSKCTPDTVVLLRKLLGNPGQTNDGKYKANKTECRPPSSKSARLARARAPTKTPVYRGPASDNDTPSLSRHQKLALATDVFNIASKSISGYIEQRGTLASGSASKPKKKSMGDGHLQTPKSPLQPTSPNRKIVRSPAKVKSTQEHLRNQDTASSGVGSVVDCARAALSCLRILNNEDNGHGTPSIQLEQGLCVLVGKLIAAGLTDMAAQELRKLKTRIVPASGNAKKKRTQDEENVGQASEPLEELVLLEPVPSNGDFLQLAISFQSRVLSLISAERQPSTVNKLPGSLATSNPSSPCSVILAALKRGVIDKDKAAKQLYTLSRTVLSLHTNGSNVADIKSPSAKSRIKPVVSLSLQLLSLEIQCIHWKISGHKCNEEKELWPLLARYITTFARRSPAVRVAEYDYIKESFLRLQSTITSNGYTLSTKSPDASLSTTFRTLGQLSHSAGRLEDGIKYCEMAVEHMPRERHLQLALCRCEHAKLFIESLPKMPLSKAASAVDEAAAALSSPLKGAQSDMEELLIESARLKKATMGTMGTMGTLGNAISESGAVVFRLSTTNYLSSFIRLLSRYVVPPPSQSNNADTAEASERLQKFRNIMSAAVDSCISMGKLAITTGQPSWATIEPVLSDCVPLLASLQDDKNPQSEPEMPNQKSGFVKLSNLYWSLFISGKESGKALEHLVHAAERSVSILQRVNSTEQASGLLAIKLEKLANLYAETGQHDRANTILSKSISAHLGMGALDAVERDFSERHPSQIWRDQQSPVYPLGRVLHTYVRTRLGHSYRDAGTFYADDVISQEQKAILLERHLTIITGAPVAASELAPHVSSIVPVLLRLYPLDTFPIRRMRVILETLRFMLENDAHVEDTFRESVVLEARKCLACPDELSADSDLSQLREYTTSSLRLTLGFAVGDLTIDALNQVLESWVSILQSCGGWEPLQTMVNDVSAWISQARAIVDYLGAQGLWKLKLRALAVIRQVLEYQPKQDLTVMAWCLSQTGLQYCRLGYSERAHVFLSRVESLVKKSQNQVDPLAQLTWLLAYSEHLLMTGKVEKFAEVLSEAQSVFEEHSSSLSKDGFRTKCVLERFVVDAAALLSQLSQSNGDIAQSTYHAKTAVKLSCRIWARLDRYARKKRDVSTSSPTGPDVDMVTNRIASIELSSDSPTAAWEYYSGSVFWPHVESHYGCLVRLSRMAVLNGLFQDAVYYGEQALEIGKSIGSKHIVALVKAELAKWHMCAGQLQKGRDFLCEAIEESNGLDKHLNTVWLNLHESTRDHHAEDRENEDSALTRAYQSLSDISWNGFAESLDPFDKTAVSEIEDKIKDLSIEAASNRGRQARTQPKSSRVTRKENGSSKAKKPLRQEIQTVVESSLFSDIRGHILHRQAIAAMSAQDLSRTHLLLDQASNYALSPLGQVYHSIVSAQHQLAVAIQNLSSHEVYCVLRESSISLPSIHAGGASISEETPGPTSRKTRATTSKRKAIKSSQSSGTSGPVTDDEFTPLLSSSKESLKSVSRSAAQYSSTKDNHDVSFLSGRVSVLVHATTSKHGGIPDICASVYGIELARNTAFFRERAGIHFDKGLSEPPQPLTWPRQSTKQLDMTPSPDSDLMKEYVDILPPDWQVVSLTLSPDRNELVISRLRAEQTPFMLFLPLERSDQGEMDEEEFNFDSGKQELQEIIKLANETAHATEARFDKKSKKQWWANREALDQRLKTLLYNVETVWFGGFRGIFASKPSDDKILAKFTESFQKLLDKHLPSRKKRGKAAAPTTTIDQNVMELFMNIGCLDDEANPEDSVMDLLYFVVDILQFHGERNAYDEIDFDMMVVEILDALRGVREAECRERMPDRKHHTILVLDRALHSFPWENLECLKDSSVSRMPSLDCLRERILQAQSTFPGKSCPYGFHINQNDGSYILNPSGDLSSTQNSFESTLSTLHSWTDIVHREPSEEEFKKALEKRDLLLYFGHGSGAQYIRGRTIKRLDRCAVTFLMGCSSGSMTEAGEFESYGVPWNYMQAGAPALVATLWDVTDKDIDRFAKSAFEQWGLLENSSQDTESPLHCKSSRRGAIPSTSVGPAALDTAVCKSREACILRYLNGAAPVVYGVPVYLK